MSVNEVPGWSVAMAPRLIGVPVALTPGFEPHDEVLVEPDEPDDELAELDPPAAGALLDDEPPDAAELVLELELHPARTPPTARTQARAAASRPLLWGGVCIDSLPSRGCQKKDSETGRANLWQAKGSSPVGVIVIMGPVRAG